MRRQDDRLALPVASPNRHEAAHDDEQNVRRRPATSKAGPALMAALLAAGFLSYALVLGADGPLAPLWPGAAHPSLALAVSAPPVPDEQRHAHYLVRSTLMALDDAHRTGNYTVLRQLASPAFQVANSAERLAEAFAAQRRQDLDLSIAALALPEWSAAPSVGADNLLRLSGSFNEPHGGRLTFALVYAATGGAWKLYEIHVGHMPRRPEAVYAAGLR